VHSKGPIIMTSSQEQSVSRSLVWLALVVATGGLIGSLYLSLGLGLRACPLCFYQRTFMMSVAAVLGAGLLLDVASPARLGLLALPLALGGLGVALFHASLEIRGALECPAGVLGLGTAPQQSLAFFLLLTALVAGAMLAAEASARARLVEIIGVLALGVVLAAASCIANPPMPPRPASSEAQPRDICWPPPAR
jgi:disulfide bond formation protein DsbB